jgi:hypothetical protein
MQACETLDLPRELMHLQNRAMCTQLRMVRFECVLTAYTVCHVYLQYLDHDRDCKELDVQMPKRNALEAAAFSSGAFVPDRVITKSMRQALRFTPPVLVDNRSGGLAIVGKPLSASVAPRVVAVAVGMTRVCMYCTVRVQDHVAPAGFKRCGACCRNGWISVWYCCAECQRLDYPRHKTACRTSHVDLAGQAELQLCALPRMWPAGPSPQTARSSEDQQRRRRLFLEHRARRAGEAVEGAE